MILVDIAKLRHTSITCQSKGWRIWLAIEWTWIKQLVCNFLDDENDGKNDWIIITIIIIVNVWLKHNIQHDNSCSECSPPLCKDPVGFPTPSTMVITLANIFIFAQTCTHTCIHKATGLHNCILVSWELSVMRTCWYLPCSIWPGCQVSGSICECFCILSVKKSLAPAGVQDWHTKRMPLAFFCCCHITCLPITFIHTHGHTHTHRHTHTCTHLHTHTHTHPRA